MINPSEFTFISLHGYLPSGMFSGALVQFFTYLQNLNLRQLLIKTFNGLIGNLSVLFVRLESSKCRLPIPRPFEHASLQRRNDKKDFQSW
jgi:hypothetical protein